MAELLTMLVAYSSITSLIMMIVGYVFKGIAVYAMAKRENLKNKWFAWIPFLNYVLIGKLIGKAVVWGVEIKNLGLWVCLTSFFNFLMNALLNAGFYVTLLNEMMNGSAIIKAANPFIEEWLNQSGVLWTVCFYLNSAVNLVYIFMYVSLVFLVFRQYKPERSLLFSILSIFVECLFGIFLFTVRNNEKVNYNDYLRSRANNYNYNNYRRYDGNGYNNRNDYTVYRGGSDGDDDPFPEFSNNKKSSDDNGVGYGGNSGFDKRNRSDDGDDFFN